MLIRISVCAISLGSIWTQSVYVIDYLLLVTAKLDVCLPTNLVVITPISNHLKCLLSKVSFERWKQLTGRVEFTGRHRNTTDPLLFFNTLRV